MQNEEWSSELGSERSGEGGEDDIERSVVARLKLSDVPLCVLLEMGK